MPIPRIIFYVDQGSSTTITATFSLRGLSLVPDDLRWTLSDDAGTVINSRHDIPIAVPATSVPIILTGDDLKIMEPVDSFIRELTVQGHYTSIDGAGLTLSGRYRFGLNRLVGVDS